ncbi:oxidoreductase [Lactobacillus selangorensis]|uniref:Oxidoreductase n=1 Tax=Lactobacillus selangorensis TaxID=81857 RepID=A0A0R2FPY3_9LACO|nr:aldo/keto reductase [Lactobacillus selangorensis]KRN28405.1 oxidoreductase [Lactobacillus selangorensis]KRN31906.1 oxidoreductase [Lactobacillus selangorensis]
MTVLTDTYTLSNGVKIPQVGFGTWQIPEGQETYDSVSKALADGYRHIDTALAYGNEKSVGQAIRDSGIPRDEIFVTSKLPAETKSYEKALEDFDRTMKNLDLDYVDLYIIHAPWPWSKIGANYDKENKKVWKAMEEIYAGGRAKAIGVSNFAVHDLENIRADASVEPMVDQIQYYIGFTEPKITDYCKQHDMLVEAYSPLATGGVLNNDALETMAKKYNVSVAQLALRFVLQNGVLPLPKAVNPAHIADNAKLDFEISADDMKTLNAMPDAAPSHFHNPTQG